MPLSDAAIRNAKGREAPYKMGDAGGLYVLVKPTGSRLWRIDYRHEGKRKTLALGAYPMIGLAEARTLRDTVKRQLHDGIDPGEAKKLENAPAPESVPVVTFKSVVAEYLDRLEHDGAAAGTMFRNRWLLEKLASPLHAKAIAEITPADVLAVLQKVEATGRLASAMRLRSSIGAVFRLAVATLRAQNDPTIALRGATKSPKTVSHPSITDPKTLGWLMCAVDDYDGWPTLRCALQFIALTAARPGEVRLAEWSEIDVEKARWTIPAHRTKMRRVHEVPLSAQALAVLADVRRVSGDGRLVFSSIRSEDRSLSENALNSALRRIGVQHGDHTAHGFRSSFSSILNEREFDAEIIEFCLAHFDKGSVRMIYNRAKYWKQRVDLMQTWADLLDDFRAMK